jgi:hypothetical protein
MIGLVFSLMILPAAIISFRSLRCEYLAKATKGDYDIDTYHLMHFSGLLLFLTSMQIAVSLYRLIW